MQVRLARVLAPIALLAVASISAAAQDYRAKTVVDVAMDSKEHTTLVAALEAANYVVALRNPGPFTVFAPTNAAFAALPAGTLDSLLKPENKGKLEKILQHHVMLSTYEAAWFKDGQTVSMVDGTKATQQAPARSGWRAATTPRRSRIALAVGAPPGSPSNARS